MSLHPRFAFVGGGVMATAILRSLLDAGLVRPHQVTVSDPSDISRAAAEQLGARAVDSNAEAIPGGDLIMLAVKPHVVAPGPQEIAGRLSPGQLVVSIAAGVTLVQMEV